MYANRQREVAKLIREGMDPAEAQNLVDACPLEHPESCSDEEVEEAEASGSLGDEGSGSAASLCETSESGVLKQARDDAAPESAKRLWGEGSGALKTVGGDLWDDDCTLSLGRGGAGEPPSPDVVDPATCSPPVSVAEATPSRAAART